MTFYRHLLPRNKVLSPWATGSYFDILSTFTPEKQGSGTRPIGEGAMNLPAPPSCFRKKAGGVGRTATFCQTGTGSPIFTETNFETPSSSIVIPYRVFADSIVRLLWVITIN